MPTPRPGIRSHVIDTVPFAGGRTQRVRWPVAWPAETLATPAGQLALKLAAGGVAALPPSASAGGPAAVLNAAALRLAIQCHARSGPDFEAFVSSAPHGFDDEGFTLCCIDPVMAGLAAECAVDAVCAVAAAGATPRRSNNDLLEEAFQTLGRLWPSKDAARVLLEAWRRGIPVTRLTDHIPAYRLGHGRRQAKLFNCLTHRTPNLANVLTTSKVTTTQVLTRLGFPVPANQVVQSFDEARRFVASVGYPVVVKPNAADFGRGVTAEIRSDAHLAAAFAHARSFGDVLVERHVMGENYRLLVIDGVCRGVNHRIQPDVIGDGVHTIAHLMRHKAVSAGNSKSPSPDDPLVAGFLAGLGRRLDDVPAAGERVRTSAVANASAGGTRVAVTEVVHPENKHLAEAVARALDIDLAGIDLITPDITRPWREVGGAINEVNVNPGLPFPEAPGWVLDGLFPAGSNGRVDITVILGDLTRQDAAAISGWVGRGQPARSRSAILGRAADASDLLHAVDHTAARPFVDNVLGRAELDALVVQAAWSGQDLPLLPVPYQSRVLINLGPNLQTTAIERLRHAVGDASVHIRGFDIRDFERG